VVSVRARAVFVDRDGTINVRPPPHDYVRSPRDFVWLPGAVDALVRLASAGFTIAVVSNQRGVGRGLVPLRTIQRIEAIIQRELAKQGVHVDGFRYCFHDPEVGCSCRKPKPGMLRAVARDLNVDLTKSWMVGDTLEDLLAGRAAGCATALIGDASSTMAADIVAESLDAVSLRVLERSS
jgi:D-glycero-D-manno-heptose 1,7-bisphosphate phosphatase